MRILVLLFMLACACSRIDRALHGHDWIVVQYDATGRPFTCWKLENVVLEDAAASLAWRQHGHGFVIRGTFNYAKVADGNFANAAELLGVDITRCSAGPYPATSHEGGRDGKVRDE